MAMASLSEMRRLRRKYTDRLLTLLAALLALEMFLVAPLHECRNDLSPKRFFYFRKSGHLRNRSIIRDRTGNFGCLGSDRWHDR